MARRNVIVFGAAGFIGEFVLRHLKQHGHYVIAVDIVDPKVRADAFIKADARNADEVRRILTEYSPDAVINLIGLPHIPSCERNPHLSYEINVRTAHNILEAARSFGVKRYVFTSSAAVYGEHVDKKAVDEETPTNPTSVYGWHKLEAETEAKAYSSRYGLEAVILRLFNVYGAALERGRDAATIFLRKILNNELIEVDGPYKIRDFMYVEDAALAITKAIEVAMNSNYEVINVGSGKPHTIIELLQAIEEKLGMKARYTVKNIDNRTGYYAVTNKMKNLLKIEPMELGEGIEAWLKRIDII